MNRAVLAFSVVALCGCERAKHDQTVELPMPKVTVHMIDPGAEPRAPLRYHGGSLGPLVYDVTYTVRHEHAREPTTTTESFDWNLEVGGDHVRHLRTRISSSVVTPVGRISDIWIDDRGARVRPSIVTYPSGAKVNDNPSAPEFAIIFPEEPVGIGARWHEDVALGTKTASVDVELLARDGDRVRERFGYHVESTTSTGNPWHRDGTVVDELDLTGPDPSVHQDDTFVIDKPHGVSKGTATVDIVLKP